jgi:hypothetical protein
VWGLYRAAVEKAAADPLDKLARCAVSSYLAAWHSLAAKLGLTPADRAKLNVDLSQPDPEEIEFDRFVNEGTGRRRVVAPCLRDLQIG